MIPTIFLTPLLGQNIVAWSIHKFLHKLLRLSIVLDENRSKTKKGFKKHWNEMTIALNWGSSPKFCFLNIVLLFVIVLIGNVSRWDLFESSLSSQVEVCSKIWIGLRCLNEKINSYKNLISNLFLRSVDNYWFFYDRQGFLKGIYPESHGLH